MNLRSHCYLALAIRIGFILFGLVQDYFAEVSYTDIDYKVFTDAARHVLNGKSPYERHTYRYSPIIAYLLVPNIFTFNLFGKFFFSVCDVLVIDLVYKILKLDGLTGSQCKFYSFFWLYNPLSIIISTRGNADSLAALLVLSTLLLFKEKKIFLCGILHGFSIHLRFYPIVFSLALYFAIDDSHTNLIVRSIYPNRKRFLFVLSSVFTFGIITYLFFYLYGIRFIDESLLYHLKRIDIRHNYSVYFYLQYLSYEHGLSLVYKLIMISPQIVLLLILSCYYGNYNDISFCEMTLAFVLVAFNSVLTCQYFIWYLCLLPVCLPFINCKQMELVLVGNFWIVSQMAWLLPAYLLEFKSKDTYFYIWLQGLVFFWANMVVLSTCIRNYKKKTKTS